MKWVPSKVMGNGSAGCNLDKETVERMDPVSLWGLCCKYRPILPLMLAQGPQVSSERE